MHLDLTEKKPREEGGSDATGGATGNREGRGRPKQRGAKGKPGQPYL